MNDMNNEKNKSVVILNPERSEWVSRSHVTSVEIVVNDGVKTKRYSAKRDLYARSPNGSRLKMTTSVSCREAHKHRFLFNLIQRSLEKFFKKNFRDDSSFCFCIAKVTVLALLLFLTTTTESRAECQALNNKWSTTCYDTWNPGKPNNCGDGCTYSYNNGKLTVTATKPDAVIPEAFFSPYYYENGVLPTISNIEIAGEFNTIKADAFLYTNATISGKDGILYLKGVGGNAFDGNTTIGTIIVNDNQKILSNGPWYRTSLEGTVILPPTIKSISGWVLYGLNLGENAKIYCGVENCEELFRNVDCDAIGEQYSTQCKNNLNVDCDAIGEQYSTQCKNNLKTLLTSGKLLAYPDGCTKMGASGCTKCKSSSFKLEADGWCLRKIYTPAEAAKVLRDDNTNEVTITFKK